MNDLAKKINNYNFYPLQILTAENIENIENYINEKIDFIGCHSEQKRRFNEILKNEICPTLKDIYKNNIFDGSYFSRVNSVFNNSGRLDI